jgi:hypothetical protein
MADETPAEQELKWDNIAEQFGFGLFKALQQKGIEKDILAVLLQRDGAAKALMFDLIEVFASAIGKGLHAVEEPFLPVIAELVAPILGGLFGAEISEGDLRNKFRRGDGTRGADMIVAGFMKAIVGDTPEEIQPTDAGSKRIAAAAVQASLESTFNALVPEILSDIFPEGIGHFTALTELPENIIRSLGVSRLVRRALGPIVTTCCTTPATWYMNTLHRPTLLGPSSLARQIARQPASADRWREDLRREGYSEERIEALLNEQRKFRSVADVFRLSRAGQWSEGEALKHLADQGYDAEGASDELVLEKLRTIESFERSMATAAVDAFVNGRIDEGALGGFISGATISPQEKAQYAELAAARRQLSLKPLSPSEAKACVEAKVLSVVDYRRALQRDGRTDDAITALELLLRWELDKATTIENHRKEMEEERAREKARREAEAAARKAELAAARALARRGKPADLERAVVLGLIPLARLEEIYRALYDSDTVDVLVAIVEDERLAYLAQLQARADAIRRAAVRGIDVGALEAATRAGVFTLDEFRARLGQLRFSDADAGILVDTLAQQMQDTADAQAQHDAAVAAAKIKHIALGTIETLVRRGHRTLAQYDRTLADLGFDDAARAGMLELLQIQIDDDAHARELRAAAEARLRAKGLSLEQFRRAVILTIKTIDEFQTFLVEQGFTPDAAIVLVAELRADVAEAELARQRREAAAAAAGHHEAPLADVARAARLGLIPIDVYLARLARAGYSDDDVALETDLLVEEMAAIAAAKAKADAAAAAARAMGPALDQVARRVVAGLAPIAEYAAALLTAGYTVAASADLVALLQVQVDAHDAAVARQQAIDAERGSRDPTLAQLAIAVKDGLLSLDAYGARIATFGYADDDVALLVAELQVQLEATAPPIGG